MRQRREGCGGEGLTLWPTINSAGAGNKGRRPLKGREKIQGVGNWTFCGALTEATFFMRPSLSRAAELLGLGSESALVWSSAPSGDLCYTPDSAPSPQPALSLLHLISHGAGERQRGD